jgi:hypothetical protein
LFTALAIGDVSVDIGIGFRSANPPQPTSLSFTYIHGFQYLCR